MGVIIDRVAEAFRDGTHLYVDPEVDPPVSSGDLSSIEDEAAAADVFIAYVPVEITDEVTTGTVAGAVYEEARVPGTYLIHYAGQGLSGNSGSTLLEGGADRTAELAAAAEADADGDTAAFYRGFIERVADVESGGDGDPSNDPTFSTYAVPLGLLAAAGAGGWVFWRRSKLKREAQEREELDKVKAFVDQDITAYGEELDRRELDLSSPRLSEETRNDYGRALDLYESAKQQVATAKQPTDVQGVTTALEEGRFLLAKVAAAEAGQPAPERRPPCFFDPRHGPSVEDVEWTPSGGMARMVPACAADAVRIREGYEPDTRTVAVGGRERPYWEAGGAYGPYAGGYFAGGLLPGLFYGTLLGSMWGGGWGYGGGYGGDGGGGDAGGGDFGGGDFGGGDFGGGGFGGGDFGGGGDF